jgi:hypothetical protein
VSATNNAVAERWPMIASSRVRGLYVGQGGGSEHGSHVRKGQDSARDTCDVSDWAHGFLQKRIRHNDGTPPVNGV